MWFSKKMRQDFEAYFIRSIEVTGSADNIIYDTVQDHDEPLSPSSFGGALMTLILFVLKTPYIILSLNYLLVCAQERRSTVAEINSSFID